MTTEFCLSDFEVDSSELSQEYDLHIKYYPNEAIKKAVKLLKDSFVGQINQRTEKAICSRIDKIFGEKLT